MSGTLYLVATPIGNLEDMTHRGARILSEVACIACEDTRQTRKLLNHFGLHKPLLSYHEHNEAARTPELVSRLLAGEDIALVSDAGTPLVSDPGSVLVRHAIEEGVAVVPIPGPSAAIAALSASGLPSEEFLFAGFLPAQASRRRKTLTALQESRATLVFYEAPHRVLASLTDIGEILGERPMAAARELTKLHEEILRGTPTSVREELGSRPSVKGEFTLIIGPSAEPPPANLSEEKLEARVNELVVSGKSRMDAIKAVARSIGLSKREVYRRLER
jgi:16S rRNA (cytidine1402-2'-O)-methyltransferase